MESPARQRRPAALERAALAAPLEDAAVQHGHTLVPEDAEHPPHSSGAQVQAGAVVNDEIIGVVEAERRHLFGEVVRGGKHVRQRRRPVARGIEIEKERAGDVADRVLRGSGHARSWGDTTRRRAHEDWGGRVASPAIRW